MSIDVDVFTRFRLFRDDELHTGMLADQLRLARR
ncbi:hypothetical protein LSHI6S_00032 [Leifsonia shinshuensis]